MFYQTNLNQDNSHHQIPYLVYSKDDLPTSQTQHYEAFDDYQINNKHETTFNNQFQILGNQSFHTISRISLQMLPDPYVMEIAQDKLELTNKYSNSSIFVGSDNEDETGLETKLITQTRQLSLNQNKEDETSQFQYSSVGSSDKKISKRQNRAASKIFTAKNIKSLLKQLKRRNKYEEKVRGHFKIKVCQQVIEFQQGYISPILQKRGEISGLIIKNKQKVVKMRVNNELSTKSEIILQLWREIEQSWAQATISAKLKFIRSQKLI